MTRLTHRFFLMTLTLSSIGFSVSPTQAQSASVTDVLVEEVPEEVLRQDLILDARSPLDGQPLSAIEYAELQVEIERLNQVTPQVSPKLRQLIGLLKFRKILKKVLPIVPIK